VAERVEVNEVGALQRAGDTAITWPGEGDHHCADPEQGGSENRMIGGVAL
jgi:hypothetical protein